MTDFRGAIQEALAKQFKGKDPDSIEIVPIPAGGDRMIRLKTLEEIIDSFENETDSDNSNAPIGYLVQIKDTRQKQVLTQTPIAPTEPSIQFSHTTAPASDPIYLPEGRLNIPFLAKNAELLLQTGDFELAKNIYRAIFQSGERTSVALYGLGQCLEAEGKLQDAMVHYEESIAYHPTIDAYRRLSSLQMSLGENQKAAETLERALNIKDIAPQLRFELCKACGNCWSRAGKPEAAERNYKRALELHPSADDIRSNLGVISLQAGNVQVARRHFQDALASHPTNAPALMGLGSCALAEGNKALAHDYFAKSLKIELNNPTAIFHLVKCAYELKTYAAATELLEAYVQVAPVNKSLLYSLAGLQYHLNRLDSAEATARKILELDSAHTGANEILKLIERN